MVIWCYGVMVLWCYGVMVLWCYGVMRMDDCHIQNLQHTKGLSIVVLQARDE